MVETRRAVGGPRNKKVTPPVFSHEFIIQNHGDIMSCVLMVFIVGLMFPLTSSFAGVFIAPQYNETQQVVLDGNEYSYSGYKNGILDLGTIFFYTVAWIVVHAIIQEYVLDKLQRRTHLSKVSTFKFTESGHTLVFAIYSIVHASQLVQEIFVGLNDFKKIWIGYPDDHRFMSASYKLFFIFQIAYWLHQFPEFYFQKLKKEEIRQKTVVSIVYTVFITAAYFLNFTRIALVLLILEYSAQVIFHFARLTHYLEKKSISKPVFKAWNVVFVLARIGSVILSVMTFWYGLRQSELPYIDASIGNFNTTFVRLNLLLSIVILQLVLFWSFISFHLGRFRDTGKKDKKRPAAAPAQPKKKRNDESESEADSKSLKKKN
ncbi:unnamed protein product [Caenorhabditis angaria]|uniref:Translocating chain-associated membrane protein n=1 Tax=Caenorhabditis angaria TaxID=860376 RepID=A0A9P1IPF7_9PELO|nr:unnamed protein product [Caenorhabditis angaria]